MAATMVPLYLLWGRHLRATAENRARVMQFSEREAITESHGKGLMCASSCADTPKKQ